MYVMHLKQIDSLDTLALLGDQERFTTSVEWIGKNLRFDIVSEGHYSCCFSINVFTLSLIILKFCYFI